MNSINLVISGNLTGFSRFYATPSANDILNDAKFDFDYRNFLTFLNSGDKAYAISFAPSVLAVSLVSRILDSFRRPGVLVVTILLPRKSKVESTLNPQNKNALYQLLNEIYNKFHDKNFINGMLNQNAAVLMQDYYMEILANYVLVSDGLQRNINTTIEVTSPNKRLGYVQTSEDNVPLYLESPCRRSFEGCHHIFFAQNPVQNLIAEEPVEVVYYRVHITNNSQTLPSVTLNDRIPNIRPDEGEVDIEKNFTYQQVLNGDAGRNIVADLRGETIELTYRFGLEEKTIKFVFNEGGKEIPFTAIMPVLEFNGTVINIPSETYTFQGKEIYGPKRIKSRGTEYRIKRESENLDLRRLQDTCIIQVEHCFSLRVIFKQPEDKPKRIIFKSNHGQFPFADVTNHLEVELPGYQEEYSYTIESPYYEREAGYLPSGPQIQLPQLRPVSRNTQQVRQQGGLKVSSVPMEPIGRQVTGLDGRRDARSNETYAHSTGRQYGGVIQLGGENVNQTQLSKQKDNKIKKFILFGAGVLSICLLCLLLIHLFNDDKSENENVNGTEYTQLVKFSFEDGSPTHDLLRLADFKDYGGRYEDFNDLVEVFLFPDDVLGQDMEIDNEEIPSDDIWYIFKVKVPNKQDNFKYSFQIKIRNKDILIGSSDLFSDEFKDKDIPVYDKTVRLYIKTSELLAYKKAIAYQNGKEMQMKAVQDSIITPANNLIDSNTPEGCTTLGNLILEIIKPRIDDVNKKAQEEAAKKAEEAKKKAQEEDIKKVEEAKKKANLQASGNLNANLPDMIKQSINNAKQINKNIEEYKNLANNQKKVIDQYNEWQKKVYKGKKTKDEQKKIKEEDLSKCSTFNKLISIMNKYKGENNK